MNFAILGGDLRYKFLFDMLVSSEKATNVKVFNNFYIDDLHQTKNINELFENTDILICPVPISKDNINLFNPHFENISIELLISLMKENSINYIMAGAISNQIYQKFSENNISCIDFFDDEKVAVLNAIPTAEAIIQLAIEKSYITIFGSNVLILGYGKCGKILANSMKGLGANVYVTYRKSLDSGYIKASGLKALELYDLQNHLSKFDFIINTIPHVIMDKENLLKVKKDVLILDLSQAPGGIDYIFAEIIGINAIYCPSLPARVAPLTASEIIFDKIISSISHINI